MSKPTISLALTQISAQNWKEAYKTLQKIPDNTDFLSNFLLGFVLSKYDKVEKKISYYIEYNNTVKPSFFCICILAGYCIGTVQFQEAINFLKTIASVDENNPEVMFHLGQAYKRLGENKDARFYFQKAITLRPHFLEAKEELALLNR